MPADLPLAAAVEASHHDAPAVLSRRLARLERAVLALLDSHVDAVRAPRFLYLERRAVIRDAHRELAALARAMEAVGGSE